MSKEPILDPDCVTSILKSRKESLAALQGGPAILTGKPVTDVDRLKSAALEA
jgi:hypothetical protein